MELVRRLRLRAMLPRLRRDVEEQARFPDESSETVVLGRYDTDLGELEAEAEREDVDPPPRHRRRGGRSA
jgi:hypothetical protein